MATRPSPGDLAGGSSGRESEDTMRTYLPGPYRLIMAEIAGEANTMPTYNSEDRPDRATTMDCGCDYDPDMHSIVWCALHAAAPQVVAALEEIARNTRPWETCDNMAGRIGGIARTAIAAARGEG